MTPEEYAKLQRDFLIYTEKESAVLMFEEFETLKAEISHYLLSNMPTGKPSIPILHKGNFFERVLNKLSKEVDKLSLPKIVERAQKKVIGFSAKRLPKFLKLNTSIFETDKQAIKKLIGRTQNGTSLGKFFSRIQEPMREKAKGALIMGFGLGESEREIAKRLRDAADVGKIQALTIARTETNEAYRAATRDFYEQADIKKYVWMSVLDPRTCLICWHLHGRVFASSQKIFSHPNCRCVLVPITKGMKKIITGAERFATLEAGYQKQIIGAKKFQLYKAGKYDLSDFVEVKMSKEFGQAHFIKSLQTLI